MPTRRGDGSETAIEPRPDPIDDLAQGYQASQILFTANRLGVFAALAGDVRAPGQLADELQVSPRGLRILCDALVDLGLLERGVRGYSNGEAVQRHLLPDSPEPRTNLLLHGARQYERWGRLLQTVRSGVPVADEEIDPDLRSDDRAFACAMADVGRRSAAAAADRLDLAGAKRLLDVGGGPGIYALEFARRWPGLEITILDRPAALRIARDNLESYGLGNRVQLRSGDAFADPLGGPYDAIFVSNLIHIYSADENARLIARCSQALTAPGQLILKDFFLDVDRRRPPGGAVFAVNMLVSTEHGDCYTVDEARSWIEAAGLRLKVVRDVASKSRLLIATKP